MAEISKCPKCDQQITIPDAAQPDAAVCCPWCAAKFPISLVLGGAPPELIIVDADDQQPEPEITTDEIQLESPEPEITTDEFQLESPEPEVTTDEFQLESPEPGTVAAVWGQRISNVNGFVKTRPDTELWEEKEKSPSKKEGKSHKPLNNPTDVPRSFDGMSAEGDEDHVDDNNYNYDYEDSWSGSPGRKRIREMFGIALGGVLGVCLAYYGLNFFGGPRFDFAGLYLPGVQHTVEYRPDWWPESLRFENNATALSSDVPEPGLTDQDAELPGTGTSEPIDSMGSETNTSGDPNTLLATADIPKVTPDEAPLVAAPGGYARLAHPPEFNADDLGEAMQNARDAFGCPHCNSTGQVVLDGELGDCPDCQGHPPEAMTPDMYREFCRLAEILAFVETSPDGRVEAQKIEAVQLLQSVGKTPENVRQIASLAPNLVDDPLRPNSGILLAGIVQSTSQDETHTAMIKLAGTERVVILASNRPLNLSGTDRVLVLGSLLEPTETIAHDPDDLLVWHGVFEKFSK